MVFVAGDVVLLQPLYCDALSLVWGFPEVLKSPGLVGLAPGGGEWWPGAITIPVEWVAQLNDILATGPGCNDDISFTATAQRKAICGNKSFTFCSIFTCMCCV